MSKIAICFHGLPHLMLKTRKVIALHSWYDDPDDEHPQGRFFIDLFLTTGDRISTEYDDRDRWERILAVLKRQL